MGWNMERSVVVNTTTAIARKPKIQVCIPHWGNVSVEWANAMLVPLQTPLVEFDKYVMIMRGIVNLDTERNLMVRETLKDTAVTHLLFVDSDMIPENPTNPNDAIKLLLSCNVPIVSGLYRAKQKDGFNYAMWAKNPTAQRGYAAIGTWTEKTNWLQVAVVGFGFVLLKREVFEKIPYPWFAWDKPDGVSEDFFFCEKARSLGYDINVFTDVTLSHIGQLKVICKDGKTTTLGA